MPLDFRQNCNPYQSPYHVSRFANEGVSARTELSFGAAFAAHAPAALFVAPGRAAHPSTFARSRNTNFWIFPVEVFGSGPNTTWRGALKCARRSRQNAMMSA